MASVSIIYSRKCKKTMDAVTWIDDDWIEGNPPILGPMTQSTWLGSLVFDGARRIDGKYPDLDLHCERLIKSSESMGLKSPKSASEILDICMEGCLRFDSDKDLYIKPLMWAEDGIGIIAPDPDSTKLAVCIFPAPLPEGGMSACLSSYIRPMENAAPTDAKAAALYANTGRAVREAKAKGYDNCVICDHEGYVAEFTVANLFMVKNKIVYTPKPTGTFLVGITRNRVIKLLEKLGIEVIESKIKPEDLLEADEIFCSGNYVKLRKIVNYENKSFKNTPIFDLAYKAYWDWMKTI